MANDQSPTLGVDVPIQTRVHIRPKAAKEVLEGETIAEVME